MNVVQNDPSASEWVSWDQAKRALAIGGINSPWRAIPVYCSREKILSRFAAMVGLDDWEPDSTVPPEFWQGLIEQKNLPHVLSGSVKFSLPDEKNPEGPPIPVVAVGPSFLKRDIFELMRHVPNKQLQAAMDEVVQPKLPAQDLTAVVVADPAPSPNKRGRKTQMERWQAFYFAAIELAKDGRLNRHGFENATELGEEMLRLMGRAAFDAKYVQTEVGQIFKKFCA